MMRVIEPVEVLVVELPPAHFFHENLSDPKIIPTFYFAF